MKLKDSLASLARSMSGYKDSPLSGYAKDARGVCGSSWIAAAAIERIPGDCFRKGYSWVADASDIGLIESVERKHKIKQKKKQALILSRVDGEGYIYMDTGDDSAEELNPDSVGRDGLSFVNVFSKGTLKKGPANKDPFSDYFGEPEYYTLSSNTRADVRIHPSRIIRFVNNPDPITGEGAGILDRVAGVISAAEGARDNVVALTKQARLHILSVEGLMDAVADPETESAIRQRYAVFQSMLDTNNLAVLDKDSEAYDSKQPSFATLPDIIETMRREVSAALEIPHAVLFGREGGLGTNGDMELETYYGNIADMQVNDIQSVCEPLDRVVVRSALGSYPEDIYIKWVPLWEESASERATVGKTIADTVSSLVTSGVVPAEVLTKPTVTALSENGSLQGLEGSYAEWEAAGGQDDVGEDV